MFRGKSKFKLRQTHNPTVNASDTNANDNARESGGSRRKISVAFHKTTKVEPASEYELEEFQSVCKLEPSSSSSNEEVNKSCKFPGPYQDSWKKWPDVQLAISVEMQKMRMSQEDSEEWEFAVDMLLDLCNTERCCSSRGSVLGCEPSSDCSQCQKNCAVQGQAQRLMEWSEIVRFLDVEKSRIGLSKWKETHWKVALNTMNSLRNCYQHGRNLSLDSSKTELEDVIKQKLHLETKCTCLQREVEDLVCKINQKVERVDAECQQEIHQMSEATETSDTNEMEQKVSALENEKSELEAQISALAADGAENQRFSNHSGKDSMRSIASHELLLPWTKMRLFNDMPETEENYVSRTLLLEEGKTSRFTQEEFLQNLDFFKQKIIHIRGEEKSGKTSFLLDIARYFFEDEENSIVAFFSANDFISKFNSSEADKKVMILKTLEDTIPKNQLGREVLQNIFTAKNPKVSIQIMVDNFEEIEDSPEAYELLHEISKLKSIRTWIASRPDNNSEGLRDSLKLTIEPLSKEDLTRSLIKFWEKNTNVESETITEFANKLLIDLDVIDVDKVMPIPIQLGLIREGYERLLLDYDKFKEAFLSPSSVEEALFYFCEEFVLARFKKYEDGEDYLKKLSRDEVWDLHNRLSIEKLFPNEFGQLETLFLDLNKDREKELNIIGIVKSASGQNEFIHSSLCQYFAANYARCWMINAWPEFLSKIAVESNLLQFCFDKIFGTTIQGKERLDLIPKLVNLMLDPNVILDDIVVCDLFNNCQNIEFETIRKFTINSLISKWLNIYKLFLKTKAFGKNAKGLAEAGLMAKAIENCHCDFEGKRLTFDKVKQYLGLDPSIGIEAIEAAIKYEEAETLKLLLNDAGLGNVLKISTENIAPMLAFAVLENSAFVTNEDVIENKMKILELIARYNKDCLETRNRSGDTFLLQDWVHPKILRLLIDLGADVLAKNFKRNTLLHKLCYNNFGREKYSDYLPIIQSLPTANLRSMVGMKNSLGDTPLLALMKAGGNPKDEVLNWFKEIGAEFDVNDGDDYPLLLVAVMKGKGEETLRLLIHHGSSVKWSNSENQTFLHYAARFGNVEAVGVLVLAGVEVNRKDKSGKTALDYCEDGDGSQKKSEVAAELKKRGGKIGSNSK